MVTTDATARVSDVAEALAKADPAGSQMTTRPVTLRAGGASHPTRSVLPPEAELQDVALRSGDEVEVVKAEPSARASERHQAAAALRVLSGPDAGREFSLPAGVSVVGRAPECDVVLTDPMISARHARVVVSSSIEVVDLNSANGVVVAGEQVTRTSVNPTDQLLLGNTEMTLATLRPGGAGASVGQVAEFIRSPRVVARFPERKVPPPRPPQLRPPNRFPWLATLAPLIMGAVMYAFTRSVLSIVFIGLSPILMIGAFVDQLITSKREFKDQVKQFGEAAAATEVAIDRDHNEERLVRQSYSPSVAECAKAVSMLDPLVWTRRLEHSDFLSLRLGIGDTPSKLSMDLPQQNDTTPEAWQRLVDLKARCALLPQAPVIVNLRECGSVGVAGSSGLAETVARGLVFQLVALHSPAELVVAGLIGPVQREAWDWLEWLPHTASPHSPMEGDHLAAAAPTGAALLAKLEDLIDWRAAGEQGETKPPQPRGPLKPDAPATPPTHQPVVVVLATSAAPVDRGRLTRLAERGPDCGVHIVWVSDAVGSLPSSCRTFVSVTENLDAGTVGQVRLGLLDHPLMCERLDAQSATNLARRMSAVVDVGAPVDDESDLPGAASYLAMAGHDLAENPGSVVERWTQTHSINLPELRGKRRKASGLRALVGQGAEGHFTLDIRTQGPHALVGGTTGAGKSEFLQTWVMGLAGAYSPDRATFLFVDYKGGSAFAQCTELPHSVGLVTDLSPHLVRRALTSLRAELRHREHLLNLKKAKDLLELERSGDPECPPSLLIVVDEFAALVQEVPDFVDGVIDVAQRGRSLGLHLILATQRPAGVIKDNLRANTNLRIALRMADEADSQDVLGLPMAAHFDPAIPGRAAAKTGPGRITAFQTGFIGGWTTREPERASVTIAELGFGTIGQWEAPEDPTAVPMHSDAGPTDIARMVDNIQAAADRADVRPPRKPWLEPLAPLYELSRFTEFRDDEHLLLGVADHPQHQSQPVVYYQPDRDGNLAIIGSGGSGKSTALRTIALSAVTSTRHGGPIHIYCLDFGAGALGVLEDLPHVGAVISGDDEERVTRLLRTLRAETDRRGREYAQVNATNIVDYRQLAGKPDEPRLLLLIDGAGQFREQYEFTGLSPWFTQFAQIAADGRPLGIHVVMTGDRPNAIPPSISSTIQRRIVLRLTTDDDYLMMSVPKDILDSTSPPGRGILDGNELQFAVLGGDSNVSVQARAIAGVARSARKRGLGQAPGIARLPEEVALSSLPLSDQRGRPAIGLDDQALGPSGFVPIGTFLVAGPPGSGRTTALVTLAKALRRSRPDTRLVLFTPRRSDLEAAVNWDQSAQGEDAVADLASQLATWAESEEAQAGQLAMFIESVADFTSTAAEPALEQLVRSATRSDQLVVGESESSTWSQAWALSKPFKAGRRGLLLIPGEMDGDSLLGVSLPRIKVAEFPPGRGFLLASRRPEKIQVALDA